MKVRLLKALLLAAVSAIGVVVYRGLPREHKSNTPSPVNSGSAIKERAAAVTSPTPNKAHELKVLEMALQKKPGHAPVLFEMAKLESEQGHFQEAARHLKELVQSEPQNSEARLELGRVLFQLGDIQGAIEQTGEILKTHPDYEDALYNLGAIYGNLGNKERAMEYWKRLVAMDPQSENGKKARQMMSQLQASVP